MKRYAFCLAVISLGLLAAPATASTSNAQAKKFCSAQWDAEKKAKTVPRGMSHAKYMRQCTKNYAANGHPAADQTSGGATSPTTPSSPPNN